MLQRSKFDNFRRLGATIGLDYDLWESFRPGGSGLTTLNGPLWHCVDLQLLNNWNELCEFPVSATFAKRERGRPTTSKRVVNVQHSHPDVTRIVGS